MTTTTLDRLQSTLASDPRLGHVVVTRPHPSLVAVRRDVATVLVASIRPRAALSNGPGVPGG